jgi:hypothetical protein
MTTLPDPSGRAAATGKTPAQVDDLTTGRTASAKAAGAIVGLRAVRCGGPRGALCYLDEINRQ